MENLGADRESLANDLLDYIYSSVVVGIGISDAQGLFVQVNPAYCQIYGYKADELIGQPFTKVLPPEVQAAAAQNYQAFLEGNHRTQGECQVLRKDGSWVEVALTAGLISRANGQKFVVTTVTDISERKRTEVALQQLNAQLETRVEQRTAELSQMNTQLRQSEARFLNLAAHVPGVIYQFLQYPNGSAAFPYVSSSCREWLELEPEAIQSDPNLIWSHIHPDDLQFCQRSIAVSAETMTPWHFEYRFITPSGKLKWFQASSRPERLADGGILWDGLLIEITERKQAEAEVLKALAIERQLNQLKDDFLSTVSHELRTPISTMKMSIEMLKRAASAERQQRYLQILETECNREAKLINDLLYLLEVESMPLEVKPTYLQEWLPTVVDTFMPRTQEQQQQLRLAVDASLPLLQVASNGLEWIVIELLTNACKYTPAGGYIEVQTRFWAEGRVEISVSNSGAEIPATEQERIFEKFYRIPTSDPWKQGGTGLGLALVKQIIERLGGTIAVNSNSEATTFSIHFPCQRLS